MNFVHVKGCIFQSTQLERGIFLTENVLEKFQRMHGRTSGGGEGVQQVPVHLSPLISAGLFPSSQDQLSKQTPCSSNEDISNYTNQ